MAEVVCQLKDNIRRFAASLLLVSILLCLCAPVNAQMGFKLYPQSVDDSTLTFRFGKHRIEVRDGLDTSVFTPRGIEFASTVRAVVYEVDTLGIGADSGVARGILMWIDSLGLTLWRNDTTASGGRVLLVSEDTGSSWDTVFTGASQLADSANVAADAYTAHKDKDGDSIDVSTYQLSSDSYWSMRDSTTIVHVNDSTGDTTIFITDSLRALLRISAAKGNASVIFNTADADRWELKADSTTGDFVLRRSGVADRLTITPAGLVTVDSLSAASQKIIHDTSIASEGELGDSLNEYALTSALHTRSHTMTSTSDHTATAYRTFYSNVSGNVTELTHGTSGQVLTANGVSTDPSWETPATGGADSAGIYDGIGDHWSVDKAWLWSVGYGLTWAGSLTDSVGAVDTGTIIVDTAAAVADAEPLPVTGNAVYDWVTAQSYLPLAGGTMTGSVIGMDSLDLDSGLYVSDAIQTESLFVGTIALQDGSGDTAILNVGTALPGRLSGGQNDAHFGDSVAGRIELGNSWLGQGSDTTFNGGFLNLTQTSFWANMGSPASIEFALFEANGDGRLVIPTSGAGYATNLVRSGMCAGPWVWHDSAVIGTYWGFDHLAMNTAVDGADWGVQNNLQVQDTFFIGTGTGSSVDTFTSTTLDDYETVVEVAKIGDDTTDFKRAVDSVDLLDELTATNFWVGNVSNKRTAVTMSGDATMDNAGAVDVTHADSTSAIYSGDVIMDTLSAPTYVTLEDWWDVTLSAMITSGGAITQDVTDSTVIDIGTGTGIIKKTDSDIGENVFLDFGSGNNIAVANQTVLLVYLDYNGGSPIFATTAAATVTFTTQVVLGRVYRDGNHMHITQGGQNFTNFMVKNSFMMYEIYDLRRGSGLTTSEGADASNDIDVSAGAFYLANNRQSLSAVASFTDNIELWYGNGAGGFTAFDTTALDDEEYDDGDGTKAALTTNRYNIFWVFMETDGELIAVYDSVTQSGGYSLGAAQAKIVVTTLPPHIPSSAVFIAKIIVQDGAGITSIEFPWELTFSGAATADHGNLAGLGDDDHTQYLKESDTAAYALTILASPTLTGTVTIPTPFTLGAVSVTPTGTELNYVDGVTSAIQTQLDTKEAQLDNEAGLYAVLSDVTDFVQPGDAAHDGFSDFVANEHIDWTGASAGTIHSTNYVDNNTQSVDSAGVVETTTGTDSTLWNVDQPWRIRAGDGLQSEHGDSANIDTVVFTAILGTLIEAVEIADGDHGAFTYGMSGVATLDPNSVKAINIATGAVDSAEIKDDAVTTPKIVNNAVDAAKLKVASKFEFDGGAYKADTTVGDSAYITKDHLDSAITNVVLNDALIKGKLEATGPITPWNWKWYPYVSFDYDDAGAPGFKPYAVNADTNELWPTDSTASANDTVSTYAAGHPDYIHIPSGWPRNAGTGSGTSHGKWVQIFSHSPLHDSLKEDPCIIVFDPSDSIYKELYVGTDSLPGIGYIDSTLDNPVFTESDFGASQLMDPNLEFTHDGALLLTFRGTYAAPDSARIFNAWSFDGLTFDTATIARETGNQCLLSPTIVMTGETEYQMFAVDGSNYGDSNRLVIYTAPDYDTTFTFDTVATVDVPAGYQLWHIKIRPLTSKHYFMLAFLADSGSAGIGIPHGLFWYESEDAGINWVKISDRFLFNTSGNAWDENNIYRASWVWEMTAQGLTADMVYGGRRINGEGNVLWRVGRTRVYFYPEDIEWSDTTATSGVPTKAWARDSTILSKGNQIDSLDIGPDSLSEDDINWRYEYIYLDQVHGFNRALQDSIWLSFPVQSENGDTTWLLTDSAGDITAGDDDTVNITGYVPYACTIDSLEVYYQVSSGSEIVDSWLKAGSSGLTDSTAILTNTTDLTSTTWATAQYYVNFSATAGERFTFKYIVNFDTDNDRLRIGWVRLRIKR